MAAGVSVMEGQTPLDFALSMRREAPIGLYPMRWCKKRPSKRKSSDYLLEAPLSQTAMSATKHSRGQQPRQPSSSQRLSRYLCAEVAFAFTVFSHGDHHEGFRFHFPEHHHAYFQGTKRYRLRSDVDGPNTLEASRKKRRLHSHLTTSRLSRPFSQPATHILNRQGKKAGDRRFWKMAAAVDLSRRAAHLQATSYLRYSLMNRLRKRLGLVKGAHSEQHHGQGIVVVQERDTSARAPWRQQQQQQQAVVKADKGKKQRPDASTENDAPPPIPPTAAPLQSTPTTLTHQATKPLTCRLSNPVALPLPSADAAVTIDRISSRICPAPSSPEPRPPSAWMHDDHEEDGFAFLHLEYEYAAEEDLEHVYCDFDTIFGAKSTAPSDLQPSEDHTYEEYMDELDGISWRLR